MDARLTSSDTIRSCLLVFVQSYKYQHVIQLYGDGFAQFISALVPLALICRLRGGSFFQHLRHLPLHTCTLLVNCSHINTPVWHTLKHAAKRIIVWPLILLQHYQSQPLKWSGLLQFWQHCTLMVCHWGLLSAICIFYLPWSFIQEKYVCVCEWLPWWQI